MKTLYASSLILSASILLSGCVTPREKHDQRERAIKAINVNSRANLAAGEAIAAGDVDRVKPTLQIIERDEQSNAAIAAATDARLAKLESLSGEIVKSLTAVAKTTVPGAAVAIGKIGDHIADAMTSADVATKGLEKQSEVIQQEKMEIAKLQEAQKELGKDQLVLEKQLAEKEAAIVVMKSSLEKTTTEFTAKVAALPTEEKEKVKQAIIDELRQRGLSESEMAKYKEMTPEQLTALAGGGGAVGLAALAALLRTFGPSRGKKETDELWELLKKLEGEQQKLLATEQEVPVLRSKQEELRVARANIEARLNTLEQQP